MLAAHKADFSAALTACPIGHQVGMLRLNTWMSFLAAAHKLASSFSRQDLGKLRVVFGTTADRAIVERSPSDRRAAEIFGKPATGDEKASRLTRTTTGAMVPHSGHICEWELTNEARA
jgi:hypothetical protein